MKLDLRAGNGPGRAEHAKRSGGPPAERRASSVLCAPVQLHHVPPSMFNGDLGVYALILFVKRTPSDPCIYTPAWTTSLAQPGRSLRNAPAPAFDTRRAS